MEFYDKQGNVITLDQWATLVMRRDYKIVQQDHVHDLMVSTVWLGIDYGYGYGCPDGMPPLIFETMVLTPTCSGVGHIHRTPTEDAALAVHDQVLAAVTAGEWPDD